MNLMNSFSLAAAADIVPMQAVVGGIAAQEVIKVKLYCRRMTKD
jgi:hypothetical protein